jgi:hypothetical protein
MRKQAVIGLIGGMNWESSAALAAVDRALALSPVPDSR